MLLTVNSRMLSRPNLIIAQDIAVSFNVYGGFAVRIFVSSFISFLVYMQKYSIILYFQAFSDKAV